jgi:hypothetical protein
MLSRTNSRFIYVFTVALVGLFILDLLSLITVAFINLQLEEYPATNFFIYLKLIFEIAMIFRLVYWQINKRNLISKVLVRQFVLMIVILITMQFSLQYMLNYTQILDTMNIVRNKILLGNPALAVSYSQTTYISLRYVVTVYQSLSSDFVLFFEMMLFVGFIHRSHYLEVDNDEIVEYDHLMYPYSKRFVAIGLLFTTFLTLNVSTILYETLADVLYFNTTLVSFILSIGYVYISFKIYGLQFSKATRNTFKAYHQILSVFAYLIIALSFAALLFHLFIFEENIFKVQVYATILSAILGSYLVFQTKRTMTYFH